MISGISDPTPDRMWSIPPGYRCYIESFLGRGVVLGRVLSLEDASDVAYLRKIVSAIPELAQAVDAHLADYLRLMPEPFWRSLYDGPVVVVPAGPMRLAVYELAYLLHIVGLYKSLSTCEGAIGFLQALRNPTQLAATFFEIETAHWCATRAVTKSLQFFPTVHSDGRVTRPDYLWSTSLGDLYCECKRSSEFEDRFRRRSDSIMTCINEEVRSSVVPEVRFDFFVERTAGAEESVRKLVQMTRGQLTPGKRLVDRHVTLTIAVSDGPVPKASVLMTSNVSVGTTVTPASHRHATHTLEVAAPSYWGAVAARLLRDARTQLPKDAASAVMICLPTSRAAQLAKPKVESLIRQPEYASTPWIALWAQGGALAIWRNDQPFDSKLHA